MVFPVSSSSKRKWALSSQSTKIVLRRITKRWHRTSDQQNGNENIDRLKSTGIGTIAGLLGSLAGMGGGFVMIPMMTSRSLLGLTQHQAHGTSLFAVTATGMAGAISYADLVQWDAAAAIALTGMVTARLGAKAVTKLSEQTLKRALGMLMLFIAPAVPLKGYLLEQAKKRENHSETNQSRDSAYGRLLVPASIGIGSGYLAGVFGVGGGVLVVPALAVFTDCNHYQALATSLAAMAVPAATGTITHYCNGNVAIRVAPFLSIGAFLGAYFGGKMAVMVDEGKLRWGFSGLMVVLGLRTLAKV